MPTVTYTVLDGEIVEENRNGVITDYVADPLGSTVALLDGSHTKSDTINYWPYGEVQSRSGSTPMPFQFVGTLGYYRDSSTRTYVRARYYRQGLGRWQTVDHLWPDEPTFEYGANSPISLSDSGGFQAPSLGVGIGAGVALGLDVGKLCVIRECSLFGFSDEGGCAAGITTHKYICAISPHGRKCAGGLYQQGVMNENDPCYSHTTENGTPVVCRVVSTDCRYAALACACLKKLRANPPKYDFPCTTCYSLPNLVYDCICDEMKKWTSDKGWECVRRLKGIFLRTGVASAEEGAG